MKKKTRKFISTGLVLCLLLLIVGNCYAVDNTDNTLTLTATDVNIIKNTNNPVEGSLYSAYNALPTARVIDLAGMSGGMAIVSNFTVDGRAIEDGTIVLGGF